MPRLKTIRGSWLHRRLGDRLIDHRLWQPDREAVARGLAIGTFFSMLPVPMQMLPAAVIAILARANVPCAIGACWITNPVTAPVFLVLQIQIGFYLLGKGTGWQYLLEHGALELMLKVPLPLVVGAFVTAIVFSGIAYFCGLGVFDRLAAFLARNAKRRQLLLENRVAPKQEVATKDSSSSQEQRPGDPPAS
jgi:uncharacterized protein (DUF2062 family)